MKRIFCLSFFLVSLALARTESKITRSAELEETDSQGYVLQTFAYVKHTLSEFKSKSQSNRFEFSDDMASPVSKKVQVFSRIRKFVTECGSTRYTGRSDKADMVLIDHSSRLCDDFKPYTWELRILSKRGGTRYFRGNPKEIGGTPDCSKYAQNTICIALFQPATCFYKEMSAPGSNPCHATAALKQALCEQGIDPESVANEIRCGITIDAPCPLPMCAAPPVGCHYESSPDLNPEKCPLYPCGILKCDSQPE